MRDHVHLLTYNHTRDLFSGNEFKEWVKKYFKDVLYMGTKVGNYNPQIEISNWMEVEGKLPKSYKPHSAVKL